MDAQAEIWKRILTGPESDMILRAAVRRVGYGLSNMVNKVINGSPPKTKMIPIARVATHAGAPDAEMVGIYLRIESGLRGQAILMLPLNFALNLVDLVVGTPRGSSVELGVMERSALAEVGNLTLSYFLNTIASFTEDPEMFQPSPPVVMVDMLGAILNIIAAPAAFVSDELYLIETIFRDIEKTVWVRFWVLPDPSIPWSQFL
ncbi:MAG: hypothetical protein JXA21_04850 [Anaerolineae bacterium]|nr:hypothetical protein [Anaerolineae bacterium]